MVSSLPLDAEQSVIWQWLAPLLTRRVGSYAGFQRESARAMTEPLTLTTERIDDIPLLLAHLERMGLQPLLDEHFPTHGN